MPERHLHEEEPAPVRTIPQGTQAEGVEFAHEDRDINIAETLRWFGALAVVTFVSAGLMFGLFRLLLHNEVTNDPDVPLMMNAQQPPPAPRVLPNRTDNPPGPLLGRAVGGAPEAPPGEWQREDDALVQHGLWDPATKRAILPQKGVDAVLGAAPAPAAAEPGALPPSRERTMDPGLQQPMPSNASGGLKVENGIR